jgi:hypothetical protein
MRLTTLLLAPLAALAALQEPAQQAPRLERLAWRFDSEKELADFEGLTGTWTISAGSLWCTTKGAREELRLRRSLNARGSATLTLFGGGRVALLLKAGAQETLVRVDRGEGRIAVEADGAPLAERSFEAKPTGLLSFKVAWELDQLHVTAGDDEPFDVARPGAKAPFDSLAIVSLKSQPRFDALVVEREPVVELPPDVPGGRNLTEPQKVAVEQAGALLAADDVNGAFDRLRDVLGDPPPPASEWPAPLLVMAQKVALKRPVLAGREPLAAVVKTLERPAADGTATLTLPLRPGWSCEAATVRRTDGPVFTASCTDPLVAVEVFRYDQKLTYWFGRDPKLVYTSGGGGATLGRARADEQQDLHAGATRVRDFDRSAREIAGEKAWEYELSWPDPDDKQKTMGQRELFLLHRGDTWRITLVGSPLAQQVAADDIAWLLARFALAH